LRAAREDEPAAQLEFARKLARGPDCTQAIHWYKEAAAHGQSPAMYELASLYLTNKCGANRSQAFVWFTIGSRFGSTECKTEARKQARYLTAAQRQRLQLIAEQWIKKHPGSEKQEDEEEEH
jgi:TPR repeat protein